MEKKMYIPLGYVVKHMSMHLCSSTWLHARERIRMASVA